MDKIYCLTNKINGHQYIGFTTRDNVQDRFTEHCNAKNMYPIQLAIRKYGKENFDISVMYEGKDAIDKEDMYIKKLGCDYNVAPGGGVPPIQTGKHWKLTEETKQKMRKPKAPRTKEHTENQRKTLLGKTPWNKGKYKENVSSHAIYMREYNKKRRGEIK